MFNRKKKIIWPAMFSICLCLFYITCKQASWRKNSKLKHVLKLSNNKMELFFFKQTNANKENSDTKVLLPFK